MRTVYELHPSTPYYTDDIRAGLEAYDSEGHEITMLSPLQQTVDHEASEGLTEPCEAIFQTVYRGEYPVLGSSSARHPRTLGRVATSHLFGLKTSPEQTVVATASLVERPDRFGAAIRFTELCKAAKYIDSDISAKALCRARVPWALANTLTDFLYGAVRVGEEHDGIPDGRGGQSVWWGGHANIPLLTTNCGWQYRMGKGVEPIDGFAIPANRTHWLSAAARRTLQVPNEADQLRLQTLLKEATDDRLGEVIQITSAIPEVTMETMSFGLILPGSDLFGGKYVMTGRTHGLPVATKEEMDWGLETTFSQRITIETDIARTELGAGIMHALCETEGFTLAGLEPSHLDYGALCPVLARLNPKSLDELVAPLHYAQYFDDHGLAETRQVLDDMYGNMLEKAAS